MKPPNGPHLLVHIDIARSSHNLHITVLFFLKPKYVVLYYYVLFISANSSYIQA